MTDQSGTEEEKPAEQENKPKTEPSENSGAKENEENKAGTNGNAIADAGAQAGSDISADQNTPND